jgi:hypothetical protein
MDFLLALASFFLRSPEDLAVIRVTRIVRKMLGTADAKELIAALGDLANAIQTETPAAPPAPPPPAPPAEPHSNQANLGAAIGDAFKQL